MLKDFFIRASQYSDFLQIDHINLGMVGLHEAATVEQNDSFEPEQTLGLARVVNPNPIQ
jgi:hypothetical protein